MTPRWLTLGALQLAAMLCGAETGTTAVLIEPAVAHLGSSDWVALARPQLLRAACVPGAQPTLLLSIDPPSRREIAACEAAGQTVALTQPIGWEAVYLVAREAGWAGLGSRELYLALAAVVPRVGGGFVANAARRWREIGPGLPDAPIRVLMPPPEQPPSALFARTVLEPGCLQSPAARAIFDPAERVSRCTFLRVDGIVETAAPDGDPWSWLDAQPPYAIAVVTLRDIANLDDRFVVVPVEGVMPTYSAVVHGGYPASWQVILTVTGAKGVPDLVSAAVDLASESMIGPGGRMAAKGLTPLAAVERVALRVRVLRAKDR